MPASAQVLGVGCDSVLAENVNSIIIEKGFTFCLERTFSGTLLFTGIGGKLRISSDVNISSIILQGDPLVEIEILPEGLFVSDSLVLKGSIENYGEVRVRQLNMLADASFINSGSLNVDEELYNYGALFNTTTSSVSVNGNFYNRQGATCLNSGQINLLLAFKNFSLFTNSAEGNLLVSDFLSNYSSGVLVNSGVITANDNLSNYGQLDNYGKIVSQADVTNEGVFANLGLMLVDGKMQNNSNLQNDGRFEVVGSFGNGDGAHFVNSACVDIDGNLINYSVINNTDSIVVSGLFSNKREAEFVNSNLFVVNQTATNSGHVSNELGAIIEFESSFNNLSSVLNNAAMRVFGDLSNEYEFVNQDSSSLSVNGSIINKIGVLIDNWGAVSVSDFKNYGRIVNRSNAALSTLGLLSNYQSGEVRNEGIISVGSNINNYNSLENNGTISAIGYLVNKPGARCLNNKQFEIGISLNNDAQVVNTDSAIFTINKYVNNYTSGNLLNSGTIQCRLKISNTGVLCNSLSACISSNDIANNASSSFENSGKVLVSRDFSQSGEFINKGHVFGQFTFSSLIGSITTLVDGALLECSNFTVAGRITGEGRYSSIYVADITTINKSAEIVGFVDIFDKSGINVNVGVVDPSVIYEQPITNSILAVDDDYIPIQITFPDPSNHQYEGTLEVMVLIDSLSSAGNIVTQSDAYSLDLSRDFENKFKVVFTMLSDVGESFSLSSDHELFPNCWHHLAIVWSDTTLYLYIDGVLDTSVDVPFLMADGTSNLLLADNSSASFFGQLDNIRLWNRALNETDVWSFLFQDLSPSNSLILNVTFDTLVDGNLVSDTFVDGVDIVSENNFIDVLHPQSVVHDFKVLNRYVAYGNVSVDKSQTLVVEDNINCKNLLVPSGSRLSVADNCNLSLQGNLYLKNRPDVFSSTAFSGVISVSGDIYLEQAFKGDGSWEFKTVAAPVSDFSVLGSCFNTDFAVYFYSEKSRALDGCTDAVWQVPDVLLPSVGYIFAFDGPKSLIHRLNKYDIYDENIGQIQLQKTSSFASPSNEGWNLIGNPYAFHISWDDVVEENEVFENQCVESAIYMYNNTTANYMTYVDGVSSNGLTGLIDPFAAFFVKAIDQDVSFAISNTNSIDKVVSKSIENESDVFRMFLSDGQTSDETVVRFAPDATSKFDICHDARKESSDSQVCQLSSLSSDGKWLSINTLSSFSNITSVDLLINVNHKGTYNLSANTVNYFGDRMIYLLDKSTGVYTTINSQLAYTFDVLNPGNVYKFMLVFANVNVPSFVKYDVNSVSVVISHSTISILNNPYPEELIISNLNGQVVYRNHVTSGNVILPFFCKSDVFIVKIGNIYNNVVFNMHPNE